MSSGNPVADYGLSCPSGGTVYICTNAESRFLGCCTEDPCSDGTGYCPQSALRYSSYSRDSYRSIPPENCVAPRNESTWYTCSGAIPPFIGCCASNPCSKGGCPVGDLLAARLDDDPTNAAAFLTSTSESNEGGGSSKGLSTGAIVGIAIGIAAAVLLVAGIQFFMNKRHDKRRNDECELTAKAQQNADGAPDSMGSPSVFPGSTYNPNQYSEHNSLSIANSPPHGPYQRPESASPSWISGHAHTHSENSSVSSDATRIWTYQPLRPYLDPISEIDGTETTRPLSELTGSAPHSPPVAAYKSGYEKVSTDVDDHEVQEKK